LVVKTLDQEEKQLKKLKIFDLLFFASIFLTFSVFGLVLLSVHFVIWFLHSKISGITRVISVLAYLGAGLFVYYSYILPRFSIVNSDPGHKFRVDALKAFYECSKENGFLNLIFGIGLFTDLSKMCGDFVWNDLSLLVYLSLTLGAGWAAPLSVLVLKKLSPLYTIRLLFVILILGKISPFSVIFWICIIMIFASPARTTLAASYKAARPEIWNKGR
jgi:hypothetical protein